MQPPDYAERSRPTKGDRALAALAYLGPGWAIALLVAPPRRFVTRHTLLAAAFHLIRFVACAVVVTFWLPTHAAGRPVIGPLSLNLGSLLLFGVPWVSIPGQLLLALSLPLGAAWLLALTGAGAALSGSSFDLHGLFASDWADPPARDFVGQTAPLSEDRLRVRELTEQRLNRMWRASRLAASERRRVEQMVRVRGELDMVLGQLDNLNHLLSLGELSMNRFTALHNELIDYLNELRLRMFELEQRRADLSGKDPPARPSTLATLPDVRALTLAVIDPSGVPLRTYGHFALDESIITGMVSAFESLSAEMFGSHVHKTQLAGGQVVHFARGRSTIAYAVFEDDPAPNQVGALRDFLESFEAANHAALHVLPVDAARLRDVPTPFPFAEPISVSRRP